MELKNKQRIFLSVFFFLSGVCFSSWASRIPTIKATFGYNEAELGTILLFMPISSLLGLPLSGWLVSRFDSRKPMIAGLMGMAISLSLIGLAPTTFTLVIAISSFSFCMRIMNISVNTQAIAIQNQFEKKINGSFHALWSTGGIVGVGVSTWFVAEGIAIGVHLMIMSSAAILLAFFSYPHLLRSDRTTYGNKLKLGKPDPYIVYLGILIFFAAVCEGGMFDWSGVFFKEVVGEDLFTLGYLTFMIFMALSRFVSDRIVEKIGMPKTFLFSALLISVGMGMAVAFPFFWTSLIGFCLVGFGAAAVVPMTFLLAGASKKYSPGMAISVITSYSIVGMLLGPPLIGYIAHASSLRFAFITFAFAGLMMIPVSRWFFKHRSKLEH
jgi:MFS family permease